MQKNTNDIFKRTFPKVLNHLMERNHINNTELSKLLGYGRSAVSNYLAGSTPRTETLCQIADLFDVNVEVFFMENPFPKKTIPNSKKTSYTLAESFDEEVSFYEIPVFARVLSNLDIIYVKDNFTDSVMYSFPPFGDRDCYAVKITDNSLSKSKIPKGSIVIFASNEEVADNGLAAVFLKNEKKIVIRRVAYQKNKIIISTDKEKEEYKKTSKDILVLGKVVSITFFPN